MSEQMVRGYWANGALSFIDNHYSSSTSERLISGLPRELRESVAQLGPAEWCPRNQHVELLSVIASVHNDEARAFEDLMTYGQYVGAEVTAGPLRQFMLVVTLKLFAKKLPQLWDRDHLACGTLETDIAMLDDGRLPLRLSGIQGYDHVGPAMLGWVKVALQKFVGKTVYVKQTGWSLDQPSPREIQCEVRWS